MGMVKRGVKVRDLLFGNGLFWVCDGDGDTYDNDDCCGLLSGKDRIHFCKVFQQARQVVACFQAKIEYTSSMTTTRKE